MGKQAQAGFKLGDVVRTTRRIEAEPPGRPLPKGSRALIYELPDDNGGFHAIEVGDFIYDVQAEEIELWDQQFCEGPKVQAAPAKPLRNVVQTDGDKGDPVRHAPLQKNSSENAASGKLQRSSQICKADALWIEGIRAYFASDTDTAIAKFEASLGAEFPTAQMAAAAPIAKRAFFCACRLLDVGRNEDAFPLLRRSIREDPGLCEAHVELCLALSDKSCARGSASDARTHDSLGSEEVLSAAATAIVEGDFWVDPWQRPAVFLPGLESRPFWDAAQFAWIGELERHSATISAELEELLSRGHPGASSACWSAVGGEHRQSGRADGDAVLRGDWQEVVLFGYSQHGEEGVGAPATAGIVRQLIPEAVAMAEAGAGEVILSALAPGTQVAPHCARTNHRLTAHLGLRVPCEDAPAEKQRSTRPLCGIRVGKECRVWQQGRVLVFDDSYEHEVWNDSANIRIVLLIRFWHPMLRMEKQRSDALARIEDEVARAQRLQLLPPLGPGIPEPSEALEQQLRRGDGPCIGCGGERSGADLMLDEDRLRVVMVARCCGHVTE